MAYDKIRVIHTRLDNSLRYVMNAEKTVDGATGAVLVGGINCLPETAYRDMMQTKRRWDKVNRPIQGYHVIHSFAPGEVSPEQAQAIGLELARRLVGDRFEAVVSTHTDHAHVHCHIVFNSVSCTDGKMFRDNFKAYYGDPEGHVFRGSKNYISDIGGPVESEAARDLINRAMASDETIYVAAIGAPTNIASALMMEPELVKKIVVVWLGGQPLYFAHGVEFNLMQDIEASRVLFNSGVPLVLIPCMNVASSLTLAKPEVEQLLLGKNEISDYLAKIVLDAYGDLKTILMMTTGFRFSYLAGREDRGNEYLFQFPTTEYAPSRIIWDISTVAFLKNPNWALSTEETSPVLNDNLTWGQKDDTRHKIRVVNFCHRDLIFGDMITCLTK